LSAELLKNCRRKCGSWSDCIKRETRHRKTSKIALADTPNWFKCASICSCKAFCYKRYYINCIILLACNCVLLILTPLTSSLLAPDWPRLVLWRSRICCVCLLAYLTSFLADGCSTLRLLCSNVLEGLRLIWCRVVMFRDIGSRDFSAPVIWLQCPKTMQNCEFRSSKLFSCRSAVKKQFVAKRH